MQWHVRAERPLYQDQWLDIRLADVELPDGRHLDHRVIHTAQGAGAVVTNSRYEVLLMWRHRFITDTWAYEIPIGGINSDEEPAEAAARECEEETGWSPGPLKPLLRVQPSNGLIKAEHHIFHTDSATYIGPPSESFEADRIDWLPLHKVPSLISDNQIVGATTTAALLFALHEITRPRT